MNPLKIGEILPTFCLEDIHGRQVKPEDYRGRRLLLTLLRNAQCATCNLWVHTLSLRAEQWRGLGLEVVAIFESDVRRLAAQFDERTLPFAVLADPDGQVHERLGSRTDPERIQAMIVSGAGERALNRALAAGFKPVSEDGANFFRLPADLLIQPDGSVALVFVTEPGTHLELELLERFARGENVERERAAASSLAQA